MLITTKMIIVSATIQELFFVEPSCAKSTVLRALHISLHLIT